MFYSLKKTIICKSINKRVKQHPFDYHYAESFSLEGEEDPLINNSYYFSAHDENMSFFARLGKRVNADETWFAEAQQKGYNKQIKQETEEERKERIIKYLKENCEEEKEKPKKINKILNEEEIKIIL